MTGPTSSAARVLQGEGGARAAEAADAAARVLAQRCRHDYPCGCHQQWREHALAVLDALDQLDWTLETPQRSRPGPKYSQALVAAAAVSIRAGEPIAVAQVRLELTPHETRDARRQAAQLEAAS